MLAHKLHGRRPYLHSQDDDGAAAAAAGGGCAPPPTLQSWGVKPPNTQGKHTSQHKQADQTEKSCSDNSGTGQEVGTGMRTGSSHTHTDFNHNYVRIKDVNPDNS